MFEKMKKRRKIYLEEMKKAKEEYDLHEDERLRSEAKLRARAKYGQLTEEEKETLRSIREEKRKRMEAKQKRMDEMMNNLGGYA